MAMAMVTGLLSRLEGLKMPSQSKLLAPSHFPRDLSARGKAQRPASPSEPALSRSLFRRLPLLIDPFKAFQPINNISQKPYHRCWALVALFRVRGRESVEDPPNRLEQVPPAAHPWSHPRNLSPLLWLREPLLHGFWFGGQQRWPIHDASVKLSIGGSSTHGQVLVLRYKEGVWLPN